MNHTKRNDLALSDQDSPLQPSNPPSGANSAAEEVLDKFAKSTQPGFYPGYFKEQKQEALKQLHDEVIGGLPERKDDDPLKDNTIDDFYEALGYNEALDDVTKFIDSYFGEAH